MASYITYSKQEKEIVKQGITAIQNVLMGDDVNAKRSLLLALDWYMDPYYKQDNYISDFREELIELLQTVVITSSDIEVAEDALILLTSYAWPPFDILEKNIDRVSPQLRPDVLYAIHMDTEYDER